MDNHNKPVLTDESRYQLLKLLDECPGLSQRELAKALGKSLGKTNYCVRALIDVGWVKVENFRNNRHRAGYLYRLTPKGIAEKTRATRLFLRRKIEEYERLEVEIETLKQEVNAMKASQR